MPSYAIDEFRSPFRMTKTTFKVLAQEQAATGAIPTGKSFGRKPIKLQRQVLAFTWYMSNMEVMRSVVTQMLKLAYGLELNWFRMANGKHIFCSDIPFGNSFQGVPLCEVYMK